MTRAATFLLACSLALAVVGVARAQDLSEADREEAAREFDAGLVDFEAGDAEAARVHFARAFEISRHPTVLWNLAQTQRRTGRLLDAETSLVALIDDEDLEPENRSRAEEELLAVRAEIPTATIAISNLAEADEVRIDGTVIPHDELRGRRLDPGSHTLNVVRRGRFQRSEPFALARGSSGTIEVRVPPFGETVRRVAAQGVETTTPPAAPRPARRTWTWSLGYAGGGVLVGSILGSVIGLATGPSSPCFRPLCSAADRILVWMAIDGWLFAPAGAAFAIIAFSGFEAGPLQIVATLLGAYVAGGLVAGAILPIAANAGNEVIVLVFAPLGVVLAAIGAAVGYEVARSGPEPASVRVLPRIYADEHGAMLGFDGVF